MLRRLSALAASSLVAVACSAADTRDVAREYYSGRSDEARQRLDDLLEHDADGRALFLNELGVVELDQDRRDDAYRRLLEANQIMQSFEGANLKEVGAIVGSEASKLWRGEPYEKFMNSYYLGIVELLKGVDDNARAGFKESILFDSSSAGEQYQCDFAPAFFLEGFASARLGDLDTEKQDLDRARELVPDCAAFRADNHGNVLVIVDVGRGPTKIATGLHGSAIRFLDHPERPDRIDIVADGKAIGISEKAGDLYFQATTRGGRVFDSILRGKAIYKTASLDAGIGALAVARDLPKKYETGALVAGLALILSSFTVNAEADTRHWTTLPAEVQLFRGSLSPGAHEIQILPSSGRVIGQSARTVEVPADGDVVIYARVIP